MNIAPIEGIRMTWQSMAHPMNVSLPKQPPHDNLDITSTTTVKIPREEIRTEGSGPVTQSFPSGKPSPAGDNHLSYSPRVANSGATVECGQAITRLVGLDT
jgi:hypothetical protein